MNTCIWTMYRRLLWFVLGCLPLSSFAANADLERVQLRERGPHSQRVEVMREMVTDEGETIMVTNSYVQLESGLNYRNEQGEWTESESQLEIAPGGAIAWKGQHRVSLAGNLNTTGAVQLRLPDERLITSHVVGLAYYDTTTGNSVLFAPIKSSDGWLVGDRQLVYPEAFEGTRADVRYTYQRGSFAQDIIIRESLPDSRKYGLHPETTRLEVWTEFTQAPEPVLTMAEGSDVEDADQTVEFGSMKIGEGRAFILGGEATDGVWVRKRWLKTQEGRTFLIEAVDLSAVSEELERLPGRQEGASASPGKAASRWQVLNSLPVKSYNPAAETAVLRALPTSDLMAAYHKPGFVMDYQMTISAHETDFTLKGHTTYYVTGLYYLNGTTILEGGAVIKFPVLTNDARLYVNGTLVCKTSRYRPAVFTAKDDNSVGETISGSTGNPGTSAYANYGLRLVGSSAYRVEHVRFCNADNALTFANAVSNTVMNAQFVNCRHSIFNTSSGACGIYNVLIDTVVSGSCGFSDGGSSKALYGENVTVRGAANLRTTVSGTTLTLTNCLVINVTTVQSYSGSNNYQSSSDAGIFQTVLAGRSYLAAGSPYRNAGTTAITPALLAELKQLTTYPPVWLGINFGGSTTLYPQATRDTDLPDLGYHYAPLDYVWAQLAINGAVLTLTNGVAVGFYGPSGVKLQGGASLVSTGTPDRLNRLTTFHTVQERPESWITNTSDFCVLIGPPKVNLRFTDVSLMSSHYIYGRKFCSQDYHGETAIIRDSSLRGLYWRFYNTSGLGYSGSNHQLLNSIFERCEFPWYQGDYASNNPYYLTLTIRNCLFTRSTLNLKRGASTYGSWSVHDNLFDTVSPALTYFTGGSAINVTGYNGFAGGATNPFGGSGNKTGLLNDFQTKALGPYYYPTSGATNSLATLIDADTSRTAGSVGLYHYTTRSDLAKDGATNSQLDIGFHYVASAANGVPTDSDGD
ncbi:MAG: hypothetical protein KIT22_03950, partial [Verrucomicrobiae bacterium]|nr:hypothetical protein [Verrucomicrobiae bacterium]